MEGESNFEHDGGPVDDRLRFNRSFTQQDALPDAAIEAALEVLKSGRLHRYNLNPGEMGEVSALEAEYAAWQGRPYCLAVTSGGQALQIALRATGVTPGANVLTNAFTLAPVPGAIAAVGAEPVFVETDENLVIDTADLARKAKESGARHLLLSHMRGHICDMDRVMEIAAETGLTVIEDCAHSMGAMWGNTRSGNHGQIACFSTQTYKHMNSGEGGFLVSDDADVMARATILSGSYMLYRHHGAGPAPEVFETIRLQTPNMSARLDALRAAILRPQLPLVDQKVTAWNALHDALTDAIAAAPGIALPQPLPKALRVGSSFQFRMPQYDEAQGEALVARAGARGVQLKFFGASAPAGFTSTHQSWTYARAQDLPQTDRILSTLFDLRLPLTFTVHDARTIGEVLVETIRELEASA